MWKNPLTKIEMSSAAGLFFTSHRVDPKTLLSAAATRRRGWLDRPHSTAGHAGGPGDAVNVSALLPLWKLCTDSPCFSKICFQTYKKTHSETWFGVWKHKVENRTSVIRGNHTNRSFDMTGRVNPTINSHPNIRGSKSSHLSPCLGWIPRCGAEFHATFFGFAMQHGSTTQHHGNARHRELLGEQFEEGCQSATWWMDPWHPKILVELVLLGFL